MVWGISELNVNGGGELSAPVFGGTEVGVVVAPCRSVQAVIIIKIPIPMIASCMDGRFVFIVSLLDYSYTNVVQYLIIKQEIFGFFESLLCLLGFSYWNVSQYLISRQDFLSLLKC